MATREDIRRAIFLVRQDDDHLPPDRLTERASELAYRLADAKGLRVALTSGRADVIAPALIACAEADRELLLLRSTFAPEADVWGAWGVSEQIGEDLSLAPRASGRPGIGAFAVLLTTSGTTGTPKVARHTIERLTGRVRRPSDAEVARWLLTYHPASFAGMQVLLTAMLWGCELVAVSEPTVTALGHAALQHAPTHISGTPTFWRLFLQSLGDDARRIPLTHATLGGEAVDQATLDRLRDAFPEASVVHIYASTEAGALFAVRDARAGFPLRWIEEGVEGAALRIRDGRLQAKSPRAMTEYVHGHARAPLDDEGWLDTGDMVAVKGDRVEFLGRADGLISVGGAKVLPEEVEAVLLTIPGVTDARVFGAKNPITGTLVTAEITLAPGTDPEAVRASVAKHASSVLEPHKVPRLVQFVEHLGIGETGKKQRQ